MVKTIAISATVPNLDAAIEPTFGRCKYFLFVDPETMDYTAVENPAAELSGGAGIKAAEFVVQQGITKVLTGMVGPNVKSVFDSAGIEAITGVKGTIRAAIQSCQNPIETTAARANDQATHHKAFGTCYCVHCGYEGREDNFLPCFKLRCPSCGGILEWTSQSLRW